MKFVFGVPKSKSNTYYCYGDKTVKILEQSINVSYQDLTGINVPKIDTLAKQMLTILLSLFYIEETILTC